MTSPGNKPKVIHSQFPRACPSPLTSPDNKTGDQVHTLPRRPCRPPLGAILAPPGESSTRENPVCQQVCNLPDQKTHPNARHSASLVGRGPKPVITGYLALGTSHRQPALHTERTTLFKQPAQAKPCGPKNKLSSSNCPGSSQPNCPGSSKPCGVRSPLTTGLGCKLKLSTSGPAALLDSGPRTPCTPRLAPLLAWPDHSVRL